MSDMKSDLIKYAERWRKRGKELRELATKRGNQETGILLEQLNETHASEIEELIEDHYGKDKR